MQFISVGKCSYKKLTQYQASHLIIFKVIKNTEMDMWLILQEHDKNHNFIKIQEVVQHFHNRRLSYGQVISFVLRMLFSTAISSEGFHGALECSCPPQPHC